MSFVLSGISRGVYEHNFAELNLVHLATLCHFAFAYIISPKLCLYNPLPILLYYMARNHSGKCCKGSRKVCGTLSLMFYMLHSYSYTDLSFSPSLLA